MRKMTALTTIAMLTALLTAGFASAENSEPPDFEKSCGTKQEELFSNVSRLYSVKVLSADQCPVTLKITTDSGKFIGVSPEHHLTGSRTITIPSENPDTGSMSYKVSFQNSGAVKIECPGEAGTCQINWSASAP